MKKTEKRLPAYQVLALAANDFDCLTSLPARFHDLIRVWAINRSLLLDCISVEIYFSTYVILNWKYSTLVPIQSNIHQANVQATDIKFSQDLTHQKSLESVNFWQSYLKNKKVDVLGTCFMALIWAAEPTLLTDRPTLMAGRMPL